MKINCPVNWKKKREMMSSVTAITTGLVCFLIVILLNNVDFGKCDDHRTIGQSLQGYHHRQRIRNRNHQNGKPSKKESGNPVCYDEYGCFDQTEIPQEFRILQIANVRWLYPESPEKINVHFGVFSCHDRFNPTVLRYNFTRKNLQKINFNPNLRTIVLIHGYTDHYDQFNWMGDLKDTILTMDPCQLNVIVVDWRNGSPNYVQALTNVRLVGAIVARMIERFNRYFELNNDAFSVLGHSLGGHVAGFVGKRLSQPQLRMIISLDPAGPGYTNVSTDARISYEDATLVLVMHTNGGAFGLAEPVGHYDFYVNGGTSQLGCSAVNEITKILVNGIADGIRDAIFCSHRRAQSLVIYDEFRIDNYYSMAYICESYTDFESGKCSRCRDGTDECQPFGSWFDYWQQSQRAPPLDWEKPIQYFIDSWDRIPFSYFQYQIKVVTGSNFDPFTGSLLINMTGSLRQDFIEQISIDDTTFEPNSNYYYLHKSRKSLGRLISMNVTLSSKSGPSRRTSREAIANEKKEKSLDTRIFGGIFGSNKGTKNRDNADQDSKPFIDIQDIFVQYMNGYEEEIRYRMSSRLNSVRTTVVLDRKTWFFDINNRQPIPTPMPDFGQKD